MNRDGRQRKKTMHKRWKITTICVMMLFSTIAQGTNFSLPTKLITGFTVHGEIEPPTATWIPNKMMTPKSSNVGTLVIGIPQDRRANIIYVSLSDSRKGQGDIITFDGPQRVESSRLTPKGTTWKKIELTFGTGFVSSSNTYEDLAFDVIAEKGEPADAYPLLPGEYSGSVDVVYMTE